jgi:beta-galactosidase
MLMKGLYIMISYLRYFVLSFMCVISLSVFSGELNYNYAIESNKKVAGLKLKIQDYDLYYDAVPKIDLSGYWKFIKLPNTNGKPKWVGTKYKEQANGQMAIAGFVFDGKENPKDDIGTVKGFWKKNYDDSKWSEMFVPWNWNQHFAPNDNKQERYNFGGVGWYRRKTVIPESFHGKRIILHFDFVERDAEVFVNGKKVGTHSNLVNHSRTWIGRGHNTEDFELDITDAALPGKENVIAVRVYSPGVWTWRFKYGHKNGPGGIEEPCWIEAREPIYTNYILVTPHLNKSTIDIAVQFINTFTETQTLKLNLTAYPWQSHRYISPVKNASVSKNSFKNVVLKPGKNWIKLKMKLNSPVYWSPDVPFLYGIDVLGEGGKLGDKPVLLGRNRFGFREFTIPVPLSTSLRSGGKTSDTKPQAVKNTPSVTSKKSHLGDQFYMNGERTYLRGLALYEPYRANLLYAANYDGWMERWLKSIKKSNFNFFRLHDGNFPDVVYDIADEQGLMICNEWVESDGWNHKIEAHKKRLPAIRKRIWSVYNHPSIVTYSLGNEIFMGGDRTENHRKAVNARYDYYKTLDRTRPITPCSGRRPEKEFIKADYNVYHTYRGKFRGYWPILEGTLKDFKEKFKKVSKGVDKPMIHGEGCAWVHYWNSMFEPMRKDLPKVDRKKYTKLLANMNPEAMRKGKTYGGTRFSSQVGGISIWLRDFGIRTYLKDKDSLEAAYTDSYRKYRSKGHSGGIGQSIGNRFMIDLFRRNSDIQVGTGLHSLDQLFSGDKNFKPCMVYKTIQKAFSPFYICPDILKRNVFAGKSLKTKLFVFNDSFHAEKAVTVKVSVQNSAEKVYAEKDFQVGDFKNGTRREFDLNLPLPDTMKTGTYYLKLKMYSSSRKFLIFTSSRMLFEDTRNIFVLGSDKRIYSEKWEKTALYLSGNNAARKSIEKLLAKTRTPYTMIKNLKELNKYKVLIIGQNSIDQKVKSNAEDIINWLEDGGKLLCMEQHKTGSLPWFTGMKTITSGRVAYADIILPDHPVFKDLTQSEFSYWGGSGKNREVYNYYTLPIQECMLMSGGQYGGQTFGMPLCEFKIGKGLCMISQLDAVSRYGKDSAATKYLENLIAYTCGKNSWTGKYAVLPVGGKEMTSIKSPLKNKCFFVNLRPYCNMGFKDGVAGDKKGGWTDQGDKDLREIPTGKVTFAGVPFEIINPETNNGRSCIVLKGGNAQWLPQEIKRIKVDSPLKRMFFLVSTAWAGNVKSKKELGRITFTYEEGGAGISSDTKVVLARDKNISDWSKPKELPGAVVAWTVSTTNKRGESDIKALYLIEWKNPYPGEEIRWIDFKSQGKAIPVLIAVTGEK